jgi:hypothetical protein
MKNNPTQKSQKIKKKLAAQSCPCDIRNKFLGHNNITKDWDLVKISAS